MKHVSSRQAYRNYYYYYIRPMSSPGLTSQELNGCDLINWMAVGPGTNNSEQLFSNNDLGSEGWAKFL